MAKAWPNGHGQFVRAPESLRRRAYRIQPGPLMISRRNSLELESCSDPCLLLSVVVRRLAREHRPAGIDPVTPGAPHRMVSTLNLLSFIAQRKAAAVRQV